jgi:hypothetical protein
MSASLRVPPPPGTWRSYLRRCADSAHFVAVVLVTAASARFAAAGFEHAMTVSRANFADRPAAHETGPVGAVSSAPTKPAPAPPAPPSTAPAPQSPLRMTLGVNYGPARSEVYVNGRLVGQTPFLGDTSCKSGQPVRIEIVPPTTAPLTYARRCVGGAIEINDPPP